MRHHQTRCKRGTEKGGINKSGMTFVIPLFSLSKNASSRYAREEGRKREIVSEMDRLRGEGVDLGALPQLIGGLLGEQNAEDEAL